MLHNGLLNLMIRSTCFGHYYAHHQELATIQVAPACGTSPWLWQVAGLVHGCGFKRPGRGMFHVVQHPSTRTDENVEKVGKIINEDRRRPMPEITGRLGLSYGICQRILREGLNVWKICARFVPRLLTHETQQREFFGARAWLLSPTSLLAWCPFALSYCFQERNPSYTDVVSRTPLEFRSNR